MTTDSSIRSIEVLGQIFLQSVLPGPGSVAHGGLPLRQVEAGIQGPLRRTNILGARDRRDLAGRKPRQSADLLGETIPRSIASVGEMIEAHLRLVLQQF